MSVSSPRPLRVETLYHLMTFLTATTSPFSESGFPLPPKLLDYFPLLTLLFYLFSLFSCLTRRLASKRTFVGERNLRHTEKKCNFIIMKWLSLFTPLYIGGCSLAAQHCSPKLPLDSNVKISSNSQPPWRLSQELNDGSGVLFRWWRCTLVAAGVSQAWMWSLLNELYL